jgi:hypothetical protein
VEMLRQLVLERPGLYKEILQPTWTIVRHLGVPQSLGFLRTSGTTRFGPP